IVERTQIGYRKGCIQILNALPKVGREARRIDSCPRGDGHGTARLLPEWQIDSRKSFAVAVLNDIGGDTDDRHPCVGSLIIHCYAFPHRVHPGPKPSGKTLVDDRRLVAWGAVQLRELSPN